jgi:D-3-phosphoglycerate dehydrogenase
VSTVDSPTLQLLEWLADHPRTYVETMDAWKSSCPRLPVWEDALAEGFVRMDGQYVVLTAAGEELLPS